MEIKSLHLTNFRNYRQLDIEFDKKMNIFIGNNAQGKTSLLESIYYLAITKSHKTFKDRDLIRFNESYAKISAVLKKGDSIFSLEIILSSLGKKVSINGVEKKKISEYIGVFNVVMFAPEDLEIVKGEPINRRKFLDLEIGQISSIYIYELNLYNKLLKQRNEYLKNTGGKIDYSYLDTITEQLSHYGVNIVKRRMHFIKKLAVYANDLHYYISGYTEHLMLDYVTSYSLKEMDLSDENVFHLYQENYANDLLRGTTQLGIHRDDLRFKMDSIDVGNFGSQGQQRTTALAIKLSLIDFIKEETHEDPIVLLDDVLSELDDCRQTQLLDSIKNKVQTFITTTNLSGIQEDLIEKSDLFYIENAQIKNKEGEKDDNQSL